MKGRQPENVAATNERRAGEWEGGRRELRQQKKLPTVAVLMLFRDEVKRIAGIVEGKLRKTLKL